MANLFYNMGRRQIGLVGLWDCVAFDEVAGINFKDKDGVQIMKDYMASGSFARGKEAIQANTSMVFVGNINQSVDYLLKTSHLFEPFPEAMIDNAFFDRITATFPAGRSRRCVQSISRITTVLSRITLLSSCARCEGPETDALTNTSDWGAA